MTSTDTPRWCAVCLEPTNNRCTGCKTTASPSFFCSKEHQKLAWPVHKVFCKANGRFVYPPLTAVEVRTLRLCQHEQLYNEMEGGFTLPQKVRRLTGYEGEYETLLRDLAKDDCPIPEPTRTGALLVLLGRLASDSGLPASADLTQPYTLWQYSTKRILPLWIESIAPFYAPAPRPDLWTDRAQEYLKHSLLVCHLNKLFDERSPKVDAALVEHAHDRAIAMFDALDGLAPEFRRVHGRFLTNSKAHAVTRGTGCPCCTGNGLDGQCIVV